MIEWVLPIAIHDRRSSYKAGNEKRSWKAKNWLYWDFPGGPEVKTLPSNAESGGSISDQELRPHMPPGKKPKYKTEQYCNKFNKDFKHGLHQKTS